MKPAYLQVLDDDAGINKDKQALMPAVNLKEETIKGYGSFHGIAHLRAMMQRKSFTLSENVYAHPSFFGSLEFVLRHWIEYYKMTPGSVVYVYLITNRNLVFPLFYQTRARGGTIGPGCELLCKYQPSVEKPVLPDACIQVTIGSDKKDRLGSSEFRLIRNNGDMATPIDTLLQLQLDSGFHLLELTREGARTPSHKTNKCTKIMMFDVRAGGAGTSAQLWRHFFKPKGVDCTYLNSTTSPGVAEMEVKTRLTGTTISHFT